MWFQKHYEAGPEVLKVPVSRGKPIMDYVVYNSTSRNDKLRLISRQYTGFLLVNPSLPTFINYQQVNLILIQH